MDIESLYKEHRAELFALSYRMLGSVMDAEDIVQETFIAYGQSLNVEPVRNVRAYLYRIATNRCLDLLRSSAKKRELYVGPWLPEPLLGDFNGGATGGEDPALAYERSESMSTAYLMLLQQLNAVERAIFLLRELYQYSYEEIAEIVGKHAANCRQIYHRAHKSIRDSKGEHPTAEVAESLVKSFVQSVFKGDKSRILELVSDNIVFLSDGGGKVRAAQVPVRGANAVLSLLQNLLVMYDATYQFDYVWINGTPGLRFDFDDGNRYIYSFGFRDGVIDHIYCICNPDKLGHVPPLNNGNQ
ncbi:RNA polymerase sigma factor SigJ [Paenibacillus agaridevorans]|uniref:RNA polymerase sigma factor SigJ n=1 Tax=Paenibacillus agaridevorans TaxID=171404 RepID=UPI001BE43CCA|nr:RNA polymerase sigma factor SigJ [Paenibacillus agaridevorans]